MIRKLTYFIIWTAICILIGKYYFSSQTKIVQEKTKWRTKIVTRNYDDYSRDQLQTNLYDYDTSEFFIDISKIKDNEYQVKSSLCNREATKIFKVKCAQDNHFRYYVGFSGLALIAGAGITYAIIH